MKKFIYILTGLLLGLVTVNANNITTKNKTIINNSYIYNSGKSFIFNEQGIEFSIFPDGQFDFYMQNRGPQVSVNIGNYASGVSFNSGYNYAPYLQYDEFGAIIQIENVPVFYDFYGRISQVGNVFVNYNNRGYLYRIGGLYVHYNRYNRFSHCTGFINIHNKGYVYKTWHSYYRAPAYNNCVVYNRPYRRYYTPTRYTYNIPFTNNYRRTSAIASRKGNSIIRNRSLATRGGNLTKSSIRPRKNNTITNNTPRPRKSNVTKNTPRSNKSVIKTTLRPRTSSVSKPRQKPTRSLSKSVRSNRNTINTRNTTSRSRNSSRSSR